MFPTGINAHLVRAGGNLSTEQITDMFKAGRVLDVEVVSVFGDRAILSFGRNLRLEVTLQTPLKEGQKVKVQVQPRAEGQAQHGSDARPPMILKLVTGGPPNGGLIYVRTPPSAASTTAPTLSPAQLATFPSSQTPGNQSAQPSVQAPVSSPAQLQPGQQALNWVPIPLPQGGQAWAQIFVQEDGRKTRDPASQVTHHQVKIWWETPGVGPVQVTMDAADTALTALFTVVLPEIRLPLDLALPLLQERLNLAGFVDTRLGTRQAVPNEMVGPVRQDDSSRLDRRA